MSREALPGERRERMRRRLATSLRGAGVADGEVLEAFDRAMHPRDRLLPSEDDFRYLHPGRVVLILLDDVGERDARELARGALAETLDPELRSPGAPELPLPAWSGQAGDEALAGSRLMEALLELPPGLQRVAMAEALDQVRHAHLWAEASDAARAAALAEEVFLPLSRRVHPGLERRFAWWVRRVGRRLRT